MSILGERVESTLTAGEEEVMKMTFKASMLRAADIIDRITPDDVLTAQAQLLREGNGLVKVARLDRAMLAAAHLRAYAEGTVSG